MNKKNIVAFSIATIILPVMAFWQFVSYEEGTSLSIEKLMANTMNETNGKKAKKLADITWISCEDTDGGMNAEEKGEIEVMFSKHEKVYSKKLSDQNFQWKGKTGIAELGCNGSVPRIRFIACVPISNGLCPSKEKNISEDTIADTDKISLSIKVSKNRTEFSKSLTVTATDDYLEVFTPFYYEVKILNDGNTVRDIILTKNSQENKNVRDILYEGMFCPENTQCTGSLSEGSVLIENLQPGEAVSIHYERDVSTHEKFMYAEKISLDDGQKNAAILRVQE